MSTPKSQLAKFVAQNRIIAVMFTIFGVVDTVLASVGMHGVMALGANTGRTLGLIAIVANWLTNGPGVTDPRRSRRTGRKTRSRRRSGC